MQMRLGLLIAVVSGAATSATPQQHHTYVLVHGAWGGGWDWRAVDSLLTLRGHRAVRVTLTGQGERVHLASPSVGLSTHIDDVVNTILWEDLQDVVLVGHSYGGMVITGVADRIPERIRHIVYVDAFLPESGESLLGMFDSSSAASFRRTVRDGMSVPPWVADTLAIPRDVPHSVRTLTDTLRLTSTGIQRVPGTYILTVEPSVDHDAFQQFADRAAARGWPVYTIQGDHNAQRTARGSLVQLLDAVP
jgi:pimeloyl-ACP methyl ester carboxylesterase